MVPTGVLFCRAGRGFPRTGPDYTQNWRRGPLAAREKCGPGGVNGNQPEPADVFRPFGELLGGLVVCDWEIPVGGSGDLLRCISRYAGRPSGAPRETRDR